MGLLQAAPVFLKFPFQFSSTSLFFWHKRYQHHLTLFLPQTWKKPFLQVAQDPYTKE